MTVKGLRREARPVRADPTSLTEQQVQDLVERMLRSSVAGSTSTLD
ncbi:hypothetical protein ACI3ET_14670 [Ornithinimicrobium sp. LYQ121]